MRFSITLAFLGMLIAGSHVLATPETYDDYSLDARDIETLDAREVMDDYMDIVERDLFNADIEDLYVREFSHQELAERDDYEDMFDYATRENDDALEARYDSETYLEEREFSDVEDYFVNRADGLDDIEFEAREPLRYRIGVVIQNHNN